MAKVAEIVKLIEQRRREAARSWATQLAALSVGEAEAARIVFEASDQDIQDFLRCYARACRKDVEVDRAAVTDGFKNAATVACGRWARNPEIPLYDIIEAAIMDALENGFEPMKPEWRPG